MASNASVDVTMPASVSLIAGSWPAANAPTATVVNADADDDAR